MGPELPPEGLTPKTEEKPPEPIDDFVPASKFSTRKRIRVAQPIPLRNRRSQLGAELVAFRNCLTQQTAVYHAIQMLAIKMRVSGTREPCAELVNIGGLLADCADNHRIISLRTQFVTRSASLDLQKV